MSETARDESPRDDGGPAYPTEHVERDGGIEYRWIVPGMSMRDYFAGQVVAGWGEGQHSASYEPEPTPRSFPDPASNDPKRYARRMATFAYVVADEMLKARSQ